MPKAGKKHGVGDCKRCGDECGCAGGVKAGKCGTSCQAGTCKCAHRIDPDPEVSCLALKACRLSADCGYADDEYEVMTARVPNTSAIPEHGCCVS